MAEFEIIAINYEQRRLEHFKEQKAAAESKLKYWMSRKKHCSNSHEWLPFEEKCSECGDLINFYANAIAVFERSLGNEEQRDLAEKLRKHAEWAHANELETPITLGDDLEAAANMIEQLKATAETSSAQAALCDVTMERCDQLQKELEQVKQELDGLTCMLTAAESAAETYKRERDAAIADIPRACGYCKHYVESTHQCTNSLPCAHVSGVNTRWQWRGAKGD